MDDKAVRGYNPSVVIYDELAESSYEMARRESRRAGKAYEKLRREVQRDLDREAARGIKMMTRQPDPMFKKPSTLVISEARVREELAKGRGFRDLRPLMNYLKDATDALVDKAERFDLMERDLEDQKDLVERLSEGMKATRDNLAKSNKQVRDVRKYLDELTELAATFGSEASQDLATIIKGLAAALGENDG